MNNEELENIKQEILNKYISELEKHKATGNLLNNLSMTIYSDKSHYEIRLEAPEYLRYLENGTKPHFPPYNAIFQWVRIKNILPRPGKNGKLPSTQGLAYSICKSMEKKGTKGLHLWDTLIKQNNYADRIAQAIANKLAEEFDEDHIKDIFK